MKIQKGIHRELMKNISLAFSFQQTAKYEITSDSTPERIDNPDDTDGAINKSSGNRQV